jgi:hypothetical protein
MKKKSEGDCYFSRQEDTLEEAGGRFSSSAKPRIVGSPPQPYQTLPETPLTAPADRGFNPDRDRIEPENVTSNTFGVDVSGRAPAPSLVSSEPPDEVVVSPSATSSSFSEEPEHG